MTNELPSLTSRCRGCLLGGAVGDALGAPVEFMRHSQIVARFGPGGVRDFAPAYGRTGAITDDTQMSLFTAEGLLRASSMLSEDLVTAHRDASRLSEMVEDTGRES